MSSNPPSQPGWYPNPSDPSKELFWDGKAWHDIPRNPVAAPPPAVPARPATPVALSSVPARGGFGCGMGCLVIVGAGVLLWVIFSIIGATSSSHSTGSDVEAVTYCENRVRDALKSPSTANFPYPNVTGSSPNYVVTGSVDSENSFGGTVRSEYQCEIEFDGKGGFYTTLNYLH